MSDFFQIDIGGLTNPPSSLPTSTFIFQTYDSSANIIDAKMTGIILQATSGTFTTARIEPTSKTVGDKTDVTIIFKVAHAIPAGGKIQVTFPEWNPTAPNNQRRSSIQKETAQCSSVAGGNLDTSLACSFSSDYVMTLINGINSGLSVGTEAKFKVSQTLNPITTAARSGYKIQSIDDKGGLIDEKAISVQVTIPAAIHSTVILATEVKTVQELSQFRLDFKVNVPLPQDCLMELGFPTELVLDAAALERVQGLSLFGAKRDLSGKIDTTKNQYTIFNGCTSYKVANLTAIAYFNKVANPISTMPTSPLTIRIKDKTGVMIAEQKDIVRYISEVGTLQAQTVDAEQKKARVNSTFIFTFTPSHKMFPNSAFTAVLPAQFKPTARTEANCQVIPVRKVDSSAKCTVVGQTITVTKPFGPVNNYNPGVDGLVSFKIADIQTPDNTSPTGQFIMTSNEIQLGTNALFPIDQTKVNNLFQSIPNDLTLARALPASTLSYDVTEYTFEFVNNNPIPQNGYVQVDIPVDSEFVNPLQNCQTCRAVSGMDTAGFSCTCTNKMIKATGGFASGGAPIGRNMKFKITGVRNPISLERSQPFIITTYTSDGFKIDTSTQATVNMQTVTQLKQVSLGIASSQNAATTTYTLTVSPNSPLVTGDQIVITPPTQVTSPTGPVCKGTSSNLENSLTCKTEGKDVFISLTLKSGSNQIGSGDIFVVEVQGYINPTTTKPTDTFKFKSINKNNYLINDYSPPRTIQTDTPATIQVISVTQDSKNALEVTNIVIQWQTLHTLPLGGIIEIYIPSQLEVITNKFGCNSNTGNTIQCTFNSQNRIVTIKNLVTADYPGGSNLVLKLLSIKNSRYATPTDSFIVTTKTNAGDPTYLIDYRNTGISVTTNCDFPCQSCTSAKGNCTSCLASNTPNILVQSGSCVETCREDYIHRPNNFCEACNTTCGACLATDLNHCTKCGKASHKFIHNNKCTSQCPDGFYGDNNLNQCFPCQSPCSKCVDSPTKCTYCRQDLGNNKAHNFNCVFTCPKEITVDINNVCTSCINNCATCQVSPATCLTCDQGYKFYLKDSTCRANCPPEVSIERSKYCYPCHSSCAACVGNEATCVSCKPGLFLTSNKQCLGSCPGSNEVPINGVCVQCHPSCTLCQNSTTTCSECSIGYYLFNNTCVVKCPHEYKAVDDKRVCAPKDLQCPHMYVIDESGTSCIPSSIKCNAGYTLSPSKQECVPEPKAYFPFPNLIILFLMCVFILITRCFFKKTVVVTCFINAFSIMEFITIFSQLVQAGILGMWGIFSGTFISLTMLLVMNAVFLFWYYFRVRKDNHYRYWLQTYKYSSFVTSYIVGVFNFKLIRMQIAGFLGLNMFSAPFDKILILTKPLLICTLVTLGVSVLPLVITDIAGFFTITWGFQLLVTCIESFLIQIGIAILTFIEFWQMHRKRPKEIDYKADFGDRHFETFGAMVKKGGADEEYLIQAAEKRAELLSMLASKVKRENGFEGMDMGLDEANLRNCASAREQCMGDETERHKNRVFGSFMSEPPSPHRRDHDHRFTDAMDDLFNAYKENYQVDNCYAEKKKVKKGKKKSKKKKRQESPEPSVPTMTRATQTYLRDILTVTLGNAYLFQNVKDNDFEIMLDYRGNSLSGSLDATDETNSLEKGLNDMWFVPMVDVKDILGDFPVDENDNFVMAKDKYDRFTDKKGRLVNERGYLVDQKGNVINDEGKVVFFQDELTPDGEIPAPFEDDGKLPRVLELKGKEESENIKLTNEDQQVYDTIKTDNEVKTKRSMSQNQTRRSRARKKSNSKTRGLDNALPGLSDISKHALQRILIGAQDKQLRTSKGFVYLNNKDQLRMYHRAIKMSNQINQHYQTIVTDDKTINPENLGDRFEEIKTREMTIEQPTYGRHSQPDDHNQVSILHDSMAHLNSSQHTTPEHVQDTSTHQRSIMQSQVYDDHMDDVELNSGLKEFKQLHDAAKQLEVINLGFSAERTGEQFVDSANPLNPTSKTALSKRPLTGKTRGLQPGQAGRQMKVQKRQARVKDMQNIYMSNIRMTSSALGPFRGRSVANTNTGGNRGNSITDTMRASKNDIKENQAIDQELMDTLLTHGTTPLNHQATLQHVPEIAKYLPTQYPRVPKTRRNAPNSLPRPFASHTKSASKIGNIKVDKKPLGLKKGGWV